MSKNQIGKGRSKRTYKNKVRELTKRYRQLYKAGEKRKKSNPQGTYFCDKYSTVDIFLKSVTVKKENITKR